MVADAIMVRAEAEEKYGDCCSVGDGCNNYAAIKMVKKVIVTKANLFFVLVGKASGHRNLSILVQVLFPVSLAVTMVVDVVIVLEP